MEKKYYLRGLGLGIIVTAVIMGIVTSGGRKTREMTDDEIIARAKELGMTENTYLLEPAEEEEKEEEPAEEKEPVKKDVAVRADAVQKKDEKADDTGAAGTGDEAQQAGTAAGADAAQAGEKPTVDTPEPVQTTSAASTRTETTSAATTQTKPKSDTNEMNKQDDSDNKPAQTQESANDTKPSFDQNEGDDSRPASTGTKSVTIVSGDSSYGIAKKLEAAGVVASASAYDTYLCEHGYDKKLRTGTFEIPADATEEQIARIVTGQ